MHYYFVDEKINKQFILKNANFNHAVNVVNLKVGEQIVCNYNNQSFLSKITLISAESVEVEIIKELSSTEFKIRTIAILGIIREQKWDYVLQKLTELGVSEIVPVVFKRSIVKIDQKSITKKLARWGKICEDAAEQSHRSTTPIIHPPISNLKALEQYKSALNLVAWEDTNESSLKQAFKTDFDSISFVIGPEGGIDAQEIKTLETMGFKTVGLGKRILRAETAPILLMSSLIYEKELS
ncbi:RsmE family RNA methyltransferase [Williamsoniiplasma luminosum]|uniref:Ribosomal RNA small subunit methyltransferase E n=1 Tax=Williamsoniiplasma luminosum TaxID=214888 RepID=A0A2S0NL11_9MOLU|nr:16S rRNA (uracil(1498)-N(3))-methyltransferase [Williamsoniiplasma luminosum]AVP49696.1 MAG: 16S rRNA methyltransferase [Williamsoniiplasma luminosum]